MAGGALEHVRRVKVRGKFVESVLPFHPYVHSGIEVNAGYDLQWGMVFCPGLPSKEGFFEVQDCIRCFIQMLQLSLYYAYI